MNKSIEFNENLDTPFYCPSLLENLQQKHQYFEVPDIDSKITRQNNPLYRLQQDILQITRFQYNSSTKILHLMMTQYHKSKSLQDFF